MGSLSNTATALGVLVLRNADELRALKSTRRLAARYPLAIELPWLSSQAARAAGERLQSYGNECGCSLGAKCLFAAFALALLGLAMRYGVLTSGFLWRLPLAVFAALVGAGIGKAFGLARARKRFHEEIEELIASQTHA
jgi:hypothetical protein